MKILNTVLLVGLISFISACTDNYHHYQSYNENNNAGYNSGLFRYNTNNKLARTTYLAVDKMIKQAGGINPEIPLLVSTIGNIDFLETSNTLGRTISEQISTRLSQRGYSVSELKLRNSLNIKRGLSNFNEAGEFMMSRELEALRNEHKAAAVITGTYANAGQEVMINLKMIDIASGNIVASTDYTIPKDSNISSMARQSGSSGVGFFGNSMFYN